MMPDSDLDNEVHMPFLDYLHATFSRLSFELETQIASLCK